MLLLGSPSPYLMDALSIGQFHPSIFWFTNLLACHHSWNLPPPLSKGRGGVGTSKNLKREGVNVEMGEGGVPLFYYFTVQSHLLSVAGKLSFLCITFRVFSLFSRPCKILIQVFIVLKPDIICTFMGHSVSLQKMLTALFSLVWNTQKSKWIIFFLSAKARYFLVLKRF